MKTKPILFRTPMVQAIQEGTKTQTRRRIFKNDPMWDNPKWICAGFTDGRKLAHFKAKGALTFSCGENPKYLPGDIMWVRESVKILSHKKVGELYDYEYDYQFQSDNNVIEGAIIPRRIVVNHINQLAYPDISGTWLTKNQKVPNGCLKEMARLFLEVTDVRVERLQEISEDDCIAEGVKYWADEDDKDLLDAIFKNYETGERNLVSAYSSFRSLWISINGEESWDANPWAWVYEFKQVECPENFL